MFSFRTSSFIEQPDTVLKSGRVALLCDQTAFNPTTSEYLFETLNNRGVLKKIFWYGEPFLNLKESFELHTLSPQNDPSTLFKKSHFKEIDALVIELQDTGVRYDGVFKVFYSIFQLFKEYSIDIPLYIIDRNNPSGRQVEGSLAKSTDSERHPVEGVIHKHGLTSGEVAHYIYNELGGKFNLHIISYQAETINKEFLPWSIPPHNNYSGLFTPSFYSGQALWSGTNISCGIGTTRPFELFGAPFLKELIDTQNKDSLKFNDPNHPISDPSIVMRPLTFTPSSNKYKGELCWGMQLHPLPGLLYHSLAHNLRIIRYIKESSQHFSYSSNFYSMLGDHILNRWIEGEIEFEELKEHIKVEEQRWIRKARKILLYKAPPFRCKNIV